MQDRRLLPPQLAREVVTALIERLAQRIGYLCSTDASPFVLVRTLGLLPDRNHWDDELHPSDAGGNRIADAFEIALETLFPGRFP